MIARFLTNKSQFSQANSRVKSVAFEPAFEQKKNRYETSVFFIDGLNENEIQALAKNHVLPTRAPIFGYGVLDVRCIEETNLLEFPSLILEVERDDSPPRHANIIGWSSDKAERKRIAQDLEKCVKRLHLYISPLNKE